MAAQHKHRTFCHESQRTQGGRDVSEGKKPTHTCHHLLHVFPVQCGGLHRKKRDEAHSAGRVLLSASATSGRSEVGDSYETSWRRSVTENGKQMFVN